MNKIPEIPKPRKERRKDTIMLAVRKVDEDADAFELMPDKIGYPNKNAALKATIKIPEFLSANDVRIITVSPRIIANTRTVTTVRME